MKLVEHATADPRHEAAVVVGAKSEWWRGAVIYQIYPLSFADTNGDGIGDLPGIAAKLDYIASLGVDAIWISPFYRSPMKDFGYDVSDFLAVDPRFGTLEDFDTVVARAHALGMKVLIDQVYSHTSDQHAWFAESRQSRDGPKADWYVWADPKEDGSPPSNWLSVFGGPAWTWDSRRGQYYLHNFLSSQPDLNVHHPEVQEAILDVMRFWLDRGVDGFRLDAVNYMMHDPSFRDNPPAPPNQARRRPFDYQTHLHNKSHADVPRVLERIRALAETRGDVFLLAEVGGEFSAEETKLYTQPPGRLHSAYSFHYLYADALTSRHVRDASAEWSGGEDEGWPSWTFSNHDAPRAISRWAAPQWRKACAEMALLLLACLRGNAILYQGEELGLPQADVPFERLRDPEAILNWPVTLGRDGARTPMPWQANAPNAGFSSADVTWLPVDPAHYAQAVDRQEADVRSTLHAARRAFTLRREREALRTGALTMIDAPAPLIAFFRGTAGERLLCVFNPSAESVDWSPPQGWRLIATANHDETSSGEIGPYGALVAERG